MPKSKKRANFVSVAPAKAPATSTPPALEKPRVAKLRGANSPKPALLKHARLVVETRALAGLKAHPKNPRVHPVAGSAGWETLRQSLADVYFDPLIFNRRNGMLVSGHLRLKVLLEMGCERADVVVLDLPEKEHLRIMLRANTNTGDWHTEQLTALLQGMGEPEQLLAGFDLSAINDLGLLLNGENELHDAEPQIDQAAELQKKWKTKLGQLWQLGKHQLLCGDSTNKADVEKLMGAQKPAFCLTDPPYGLGKKMQGGTWAKKNSHYNEMHEWDAEANQSFFDLAVQFGVPSIVWGGNNYRVPPSRCWLVWNKTKFPTMADVELAWTNFDKPAKSFESSRTPDGSKEHPTQKPVALMAWCLSWSNDGDLLFDPFLGSGTTLIAAENLQRRCYGIEISPGYVAVILQRFADAFPDQKIELLKE